MKVTQDDLVLSRRMVEIAMQAWQFHLPAPPQTGAIAIFVASLMASDAVMQEATAAEVREVMDWIFARIMEYRRGQNPWARGST